MGDKVHIHTAYDPPPQVGLKCEDKSLTRQSEKDSCDVNLIVKTYQVSGVLPEGETREGLFIDVSQVPDYRGALDQVRRADAAFMSLDARIRREFDNDPAKFLDFCSDPANAGKLEELGFIKRLEAPPVEPPAKPAVDPASAAAAK